MHMAKLNQEEIQMILTTPDKRMKITGGIRSEYAACHSQRVIIQDFKPARREEKYFGPEKMK